MKSRPILVNATVAKIEAGLPLTEPDSGCGAGVSAFDAEAKLSVVVLSVSACVGCCEPPPPPPPPPPQAPSSRLKEIVATSSGRLDVIGEPRALLFNLQGGDRAPAF